MTDLDPEFLAFCEHRYGHTWEQMDESERADAINSYPHLIYKTSA